uniref:sensor histidine kinase n=1 Tax=Candidatus Enterococcus willemsii TaxID=1857215 RepID=UPI00403F7E51
MKFLKEQLVIYGMYGVFLVVTLATLYLHNLPLQPFVDVFWFLTFLLVIYSLICGYQHWQKIKQLKPLTTQPMTRQAQLFLPKSTTESERLYQQLLQTTLVEKDRQEQQISEQQKEILEDFGLWLHQVKTPLAALDLLLQLPEPETLKMKNEVFKINDYLQMMLNYLRQNLANEDLVIEKVALEPIVKTVLKKYAVFFSQKDLRLVMKSLQVSVYSDQKWLTFILEQLLFNAIKYTNEGEIAVIWEENQLLIKDTGIGIRPEDLPRVFEKGYTGYNGREHQRASGLGLYLCQMMAQKIGMTLTITSEVASGTVVSLTFPKE